MTDYTKQKYCSGCGIPLQTENERLPGYVPGGALHKEEVVCKRCFRIKHYNEAPQVTLGEDDFLKILQQIGTSQGLIVQVVDIFDFHGSWLRGLQRHVGNNPVLLVGNKVDLLPKAINVNRVKQWMRRQSKEWGLQIVDAVLISAAKGQGIDELVNAMEKWRDGRDVYVVGITNVGKSTLINRLLHDYSDETGEVEITTSHFPGTTLGMIEIPLDEQSSLFDTPGIINKEQMSYYLAPKDLKLVMPSKRINPTIYQLNAGQTLFLGGLVRIDYMSGGRHSFVCYVSNGVPIHRTKLERADEIYQKHLGEMLNPPSPESIKKLPEMLSHEFPLRKESQDVVISGLGWISIKGTGGSIRICAPKGIGVFLRDSLL
ncbi:ribosome biogenesis GTPase YqeH [Microaerobacter geothermalis]|uniref:ribosome biogenesis GTPase YqeH n=1 Tax=Microaerobacter geothermalis TaxID=674972 RepID=UPI001EFF7E66|nr:ribosome biogenesis GTPase YqeH [Microaerobacter geothermalis]MCF6092907.1 ribosome biogenesis GTPase YqeH [Microaerobacter geothermalis]